jgi:hypothetical protein
LLPSSGVAAILPHPPDTAAAFSYTGAAPLAMTICRENRIQESEFRIQEKSSSCLFSSTGVTTSAMTIYRENA